MFEFFWNGNTGLQTLFGFEISTTLMLPFEFNLNSIWLKILDITFCTQVGFILGVIFSVVIFLVSMIVLMRDFKKWVLEFRKGKFEDVNLQKVEVVNGLSFPGYLISNSIGCFILVTFSLTIFFTLIVWPMFWLVLWDFRFAILTVLVSSFLQKLIEGYVEDYAYDQFYCKRR